MAVEKKARKGIRGTGSAAPFFTMIRYAMTIR